MHKTLGHPIKCKGFFILFSRDMTTPIPIKFIKRIRFYLAGNHQFKLYKIINCLPSSANITVPKNFGHSDGLTTAGRESTVGMSMSK